MGPAGPPDTTPPTISMTAPSGGATVSGTVTVSANATDNMGVTGVQFLLDGANLGLSKQGRDLPIAFRGIRRRQRIRRIRSAQWPVMRRGIPPRRTAVSVTVNNPPPPPPPVISGVIGRVNHFLRGLHYLDYRYGFRFASGLWNHNCVRFLELAGVRPWLRRTQ